MAIRLAKQLFGDTGIEIEHIVINSFCVRRRPKLVIIDLDYYLNKAQRDAGKKPLNHSEVIRGIRTKVTFTGQDATDIIQKINTSSLADTRALIYTKLSALPDFTGGTQE